MKKILYFITTLVLVLGITVVTNAQGTPQSQCAFINNSSDYSRCCTAALTFNNPQLSQRCDNYINTQTPGTIGSGTPPNTNPTNGGVGGTPGTIAPTPQASSQALASCNLISFDSLLDILIWLKCVIGAAIIPLIFTIAFLLFLWGMVQYIRNADNEKKREESK
ncbi:MAG: hypothetical protein AAB681_01035, partial [Patescibacteria group bacterium]